VQAYLPSHGLTATAADRTVVHTRVQALRQLSHHAADRTHDMIAIVRYRLHAATVLQWLVEAAVSSIPLCVIKKHCSSIFQCDIVSEGFARAVCASGAGQHHRVHHLTAAVAAHLTALIALNSI
jgi:hypothetical protein